MKKLTLLMGIIVAMMSIVIMSSCSSRYYSRDVRKYAWVKEMERRNTVLQLHDDTHRSRTDYEKRWKKGGW